mgnify:CR=1 FL=1
MIMTVSHRLAVTLKVKIHGGKTRTGRKELASIQLQHSFIMWHGELGSSLSAASQHSTVAANWASAVAPFLIT